MAHVEMRTSAKQKSRAWQFFGLMMVLVVASLLVNLGPQYNQFVAKHNWPLPKVKEVPFRLGLDLSGGTSLTYDADLSAVATGDRLDAVQG
ncbi:MAG TPA: hypothetical protein PLT32_03530, partial [bacterium]|nr:hypothetical protein [bacterium]